MNHKKFKELESKVVEEARKIHYHFNKYSTGTFMIDGKPVEVNHGEMMNSFFEDMPTENQEKLLAWIKEFMLPRKTPNYDYTSYGLKHFAEDDLGFYIGNNQFKEATLKAGIEPIEYNDLNWCYRVSSKPLRKKQGLQ